MGTSYIEHRTSNVELVTNENEPSSTLQAAEIRDRTTQDRVTTCNNANEPRKHEEFKFWYLD